MTTTAITYVAQPLEEARRKATAAGVQPSWVRGDITHLSELGIGTGYDLLLDLGCFHGLKPDDQSNVARQISQVARPGAIFMLAAFAPAKRGPLPDGIAKDDVMRLFGGDWQLLWERQAPDARLPGFLKKADPRWYCLQRN